MQCGSGISTEFFMWLWTSYSHLYSSLRYLEAIYCLVFHAWLAEWSPDITAESLLYRAWGEPGIWAQSALLVCWAGSCLEFWWIVKYVYDLKFLLPAVWLPRGALCGIPLWEQLRIEQCHVDWKALGQWRVFSIAVEVFPQKEVEVGMDSARSAWATVQMFPNLFRAVLWLQMVQCWRRASVWRCSPSFVPGALCGTPVPLQDLKGRSSPWNLGSSLLLLLVAISQYGWPKRQLCA